MSFYSESIRNKLKEILHSGDGFVVRGIGKSFAVSYVAGMVDIDQLNMHVLECLTDKGPVESIENVREWIAIGECEVMPSLHEATEKLLSGYAVVSLAGTPHIIVVNVMKIPTRTPSVPTIESTIYGPAISFTESMELNIALLRSYISSENLIQESIQLETETNTKTNIFYMMGTETNPFIDTIRSRMKTCRFKGLIGSPMLLQLLQDNQYSLFPEMSLSERPDVAAQALLEGKIVIFVEGNAQVIIGPNSFFDFFYSIEDRYSLWGVGIFNRTLRSMAFFISIYLTPLYVAALTFHYQMIPLTLIVPLIESRTTIPFPPLLETLILEITIELLREAGARLPTKVGQTMSIVGAIVVGQAAVAAGFTSNTLIMLIALAALGTFTTPNYRMGATLRIIRFPMLIVAGTLGLPGIAFLSALIIIHLLRMTSYGKPYLFPIYPPNKDGFINNMLLTASSLFRFRTDLTKNNRASFRTAARRWFSSDEKDE